MDGVEHVHPGKLGTWTFYIVSTSTPEGGYSAVAEIRFGRSQKCKLVLTAPHLNQEEGDEALRRKCIEWIEKTESERAAEISQAAS